MLRNWRPFLLALLLFGPPLVYMGFGVLWLQEHRWLVWAGITWFALSVLFAVLAARWTRSRTPILPPIDWEAPRTFSRRDRDAWAMVEEQAEKGDTVSLASLVVFDTYIETGRLLARRLAEHYHPRTSDPIETVPVVDLLTALELASEDLGGLCRQVPGGDLLTPAHWKRAVQVANYFQRASDIYSYLLPIFSPVSGLVRLGTQQWMVKPAWKDMQQNLLRWFYRAYVNRLGMHLIELYSGRLTIGAVQYRRLTRRLTRAPIGDDGDLPPLSIAVAGAKASGKSRLIEVVESARTGNVGRVESVIEEAGIDPSALERLKAAHWIELPGYPATPPPDAGHDRAARRGAMTRAVEADMLVLVVDSRRDTTRADAAFATQWDEWFIAHPEVELPPALVVLTHMDHAELGEAWTPPYDWATGPGQREAAARARLNALRTTLPPSFSVIVPVGLPASSPFGVAELLLPTLITMTHRAERSALIHHLQRISSRSKLGRLVSQVGEQGRALWKGLRSRRSSA